MSNVLTGTEGETVPLNTQHGHTAPLTCPDEKSYYQWMNKGTSAEYYLNMKGTPVETACNWSSDGSHVGNWAPVVLGVGTDTYGKTWLSIQTTIQNKPMDYKNLNFAVEIQGQFGGDNACYYIQKDGIGYYCSKGSPADVQMSSCVSYDPNKHPVPGCTVSSPSASSPHVTVTHHVVGPTHVGQSNLCPDTVEATPPKPCTTTVIFTSFVFQQQIFLSPETFWLVCKKIGARLV